MIACSSNQTQHQYSWIASGRPLESTPMNWINSVRHFLRAPEWIPIALRQIGTELKFSQLWTELSWTLSASAVI